MVWPTGSWALAGRDGDDVYDEFKPIDEQMSDAERRRLLYVACTRAIDHLVVSLHRGGQPPDQPGKYTSAELLASAGAADPTTGARELAATVLPFTSEQTSAVELPWADAAAWAEERTSTLARASVRTTISATRLAEDLAGIEGQGDPGLRKDPVDLDLPPWQRGRYGTAVGRAVHGVLQFADLEHGTDIDRLAEAQCAAEGILGVSSHGRRPRPLGVGGADRPRHTGAGTPPRAVRRGRDRRPRARGVHRLAGAHHRTAWSSSTTRPTSGPTPATRDERIARYRRQLAAYGVAIERVLGEPVVGGVLIRCRVGEAAEEIPIDDWRGAVEALAGAVRQRE